MYTGTGEHRLELFLQFYDQYFMVALLGVFDMVL
jgi:hypothetical protein